MNNSIFFQILSSWEVIAVIVAFLLIFPLTFFIASYDKFRTLEFTGLRKKKKKAEHGKKITTETGKHEQENGETTHKTGTHKPESHAAGAQKQAKNRNSSGSDRKAEKKTADEHVTGHKPDMQRHKEQKKEHQTDNEENITEEE